MAYSPLQTPQKWLLRTLQLGRTERSGSPGILETLTSALGRSSSGAGEPTCSTDGARLVKRGLERPCGGMVDALDSKSSSLTGVSVRVGPGAPSALLAP